VDERFVMNGDGSSECSECDAVQPFYYRVHGGARREKGEITAGFLALLFLVPALLPQMFRTVGAKLSFGNFGTGAQDPHKEALSI
jgi:hypothetical protein